MDYKYVPIYSEMKVTHYICNTLVLEPAYASHKPVVRCYIFRHAAWTSLILKQVYSKIVNQHSETWSPQSIFNFYGVHRFME